MYPIFAASFKIELQVSVVKAVTTKTGSVFTPLKHLHAEAGISSDELEKQWKAKKDKWRASRYLQILYYVLSFRSRRGFFETNIRSEHRFV